MLSTVLVTSPRVWVIVNSGMSSQFVRTAESFRAARECAGVWLFPGMGSDMAGLMLEAVEAAAADWTFVRSRHFLGLRSRYIVVLHDLGEVGDSAAGLGCDPGFNNRCE